jgi:hypothetical protein
MPYGGAAYPWRAAVELDLDVEVSARVLDAQRSAAARRDQQLVPDGAVEQRGRDDADRAEHADRRVRADRVEGVERASADHPSGARCGDQGDLGNGGAGDIAEAHELAGLDPQRLDAIGGRILVTGTAEVGSAGDGDRHPVVDARHREPVDLVDEPAGGQQAAADRTFRIGEVQRHRGRGPGNAGNRGVARVVDPPAGCGERRDRASAGVDHADPHARALRPRGDDAPLHGELPDGGQQVAAGLAVGHGGRVDADLQEQVVDVAVRLGRARHDGHLAGHRLGTADAVDLGRVRAAHDPQQEPVPLGRVGG